MTSIALHSDLHLELAPKYEGEILSAPEIAHADVIILAGDICKISEAPTLLADFAGKYAQSEILFVSGNHEYYREGDMLEEEQKLREHVEAIERVHFLQCDSVIIKGIRFLGCTGWSRLYTGNPNIQKRIRDRIESCVNDFRLITYKERKFNALDCVDLGNEHYGWLEQELAKDVEQQTVVITHFAPSLEVRNQRFSMDDLSYYFNNSYDNLIKKHKPKYWFFGHTHFNMHLNTGDTSILSNQHGYGRECPDYDPNFILNI